MKALRNVALTVVGVALVGIFAGTANAQHATVRNASVTLPWEAIWADAVLPPGVYSLSVVNRSADVYTVTFAGGAINKTIVVASRPAPVRGHRTELIVEGKGEIHSIRALRLPYADLVLTFPESKAAAETAAKAPETIQAVPIVVAER